MGDDGVDPTELAGVAEAETESVHAWALDDEDEIETRRLTPRRITDAALAGCLVLIAAAGVVALLVIRGAWQIEPAPLTVVAAPPPPPAPSTAAPTTTTVRAQPAPPGPWITPTKPVTVTVQAPPKTVQAAPSWEPDADMRFLSLVSQIPGVTVNAPGLLTASARQVCIDLQNGVTTPAQTVDITVRNAGLTPAQAVAVTAAAVDVYCPNYHPWLQTIGVR